MSILLAIVLSLSAILVGQIKMIKGMENSVIAFYAADTGIEEVLYSGRGSPTSSCTELIPCLLDNGAEYYVEITSLDAPENFLIKSVGNYKDTIRAIEIKY